MDRLGSRPEKKRLKYDAIKPENIRTSDETKKSVDFDRALRYANHQRSSAHSMAEKFEAKGDIVEKCKKIIAHIEKEESAAMGFNVDFRAITDASLAAVNVGSEGGFVSMRDQTYLDPKLTAENKSHSLFHVMLHENIHRLSRRDFGFESDRAIEQRKVGYSDRVNFKGFNEGVTEYYTQYLLQKYKKEIESQLGPTPENYFNAYASQVKLVELFVQDISKEVTLDTEQTQQLFFKNVFTGNMQWLRVLNKIYGKGTLEFLATIDDSQNPDILTYFKEPDEAKRIDYALRHIFNSLDSPKKVKVASKYIDQILDSHGNSDEILKLIESAVDNFYTANKSYLHTKIKGGLTKERTEEQERITALGYANKMRKNINSRLGWTQRIRKLLSWR